MIAVQDRIPTQPNRKLITPESGAPFYATVEYADAPTQNGTPINQALFNSIAADITAITPGIGTYVGDGQAEKTITLSRTPKFVMVFMDGLRMCEGTTLYGGVAVTGHPAGIGTRLSVSIVSNGFKVYYVATTGADPMPFSNNLNSTYFYVWG